MADTSGNQGQAIATNGTSHVPATQGATDVCKLPDNKPVPFPNFIATKGNVNGGTTNTFIQNQSVWIVPAKIGPPSNPAHAGVNKGVKSGTYREVAEAKSWSKDVKKEGQFVVRTNDSTWQNARNTTGIVNGSALTVDKGPEDEYKKLLCYIDKLEGECGHGRKLGPPPGAKKDATANYLEVLDNCSVTFTSERRNLVTNAVDPTCEKGIHTEWIDTEVHSGAQPIVKKKQTLKVYVRKGKGLETSTSHGASEVNDYSRKHRIKGADGSYARGESITHQARNKAEREEHARLNRAGKALDTTIKIADIIKFWQAAADPPVINIEAWACSGSKKATIKTFPSKKIEIDFFTDKVKEKLSKIEKLGEFAKKLADRVSLPCEFKFLQDPSLKFVCEYVELTKDTPARTKSIGRAVFHVPPFYQVQCRRKWSLEFSFNPMVYVMLKVDIPIATVLGGALGAALAKGLKAIGIKANFFVKVEITFAPKGFIAWDEYDVFVCNAEAEFTLTFSGGIEASCRRGEVRASLYVKGTVKFHTFGPRPGWIFAFDMEGEIQFGISGFARGSLLGFEKTKSFDWKPDWLKAGTKSPVTIYVLQRPGQGGTGGP